MTRTRKRASSPAPAATILNNQHNTHETTGEADAELEDAPVARPLQFKQEITWRPGKPIPVGVLSQRLKALSTELGTFEQGEGGHDSFKSTARALVNTQLLGHKDAGVKAWTLLCITQVFSIAVPVAPYTAKQLQEIFALFTRELLPALADTTGTYIQQYVDALTLLIEDKSILLVLDVPGSERMVLNLFKKTFDIMAGKTEEAGIDVLPSNVEYKLAKMLSDIIEEADGLDSEVIEVVLAQFMHPIPASIGAGAASANNLQYPTAYNVARSVCNTCVVRMTRYVSDYFGTVLIDASEIADKALPKPNSKNRQHDTAEDDIDHSATHTLTADDLGDAKKAHILLRELWRSSPDVVQGIIPQIEAEISAENQHLRTMAVEVVGDMVAGIGAAGPPPHVPLDPAGPPSQITKAAQSKWTGIFKPSSPHAFSASYPSCYYAFLERRRDKSPAVRAALATAIGHIISTNAGGKGLSTDEQSNLAQHLVDLLRDQDDKVRLTAVQSIAALEFAPLVELLQQDVSGIVIHNVLFERVQDQRQSIRKASIDLLSRAWGAASDAIAAGDVSLQQALGEVPTQILAALYKNIPEITRLITLALHDLLLPARYPSAKGSSAIVPDSQPANVESNLTTSVHDADTLRARRILVLVRGLNERARHVFFLVINRQPRLAQYLAVVLDCCEKLAEDADGEAETRKRFSAAISTLVQGFPDPIRAKSHLQQLVRQDQRVRHLIRLCVDEKSEHIKVARAMRELRKNFEKQAESSQAIFETLEPLLKDSSILIYNRSHVPGYTHFARTDEDGLAGAADLMIQGIATSIPTVLETHIAELCNDLQRAQPSVSTPGSDNKIASSLKACANFARRFPSKVIRTRTFFQAMTAYALYGSPKAAKHAISIIVLAADKKEMYVSKIAAECIKQFEYGGRHFLTQLSALAQLRLIANEETESFADDITKIASADVLCKVRTEAQADDPEWSTTEQLDDDLSAKLLALKLLVNGLRGKKITDTPTAKDTLKDVAKPPYQLLNGLIEGEGELSKRTSTPRHHRAHLRLAAGVLLLKLSRTQVFDKLLNHNDFNRLSRLCQDPRPEVRSEFMKALRKYLGSNRISPRYNALLFLYAHEPVTEIRLGVENWIRSRSGQKNGKTGMAFENALPRLLSLLAHHQFFGRDVEDLEESAHYITFYLTTVATPDNLSVIYGLAQRVKTVQDGINPAKSEDLYIISDLAEAIIRAFQEEKGWNFQALGTTLKLPGGVFDILDSSVDAHALAEKRYLPDEMVEMIPDIVKADLRAKRRKADRTGAQRVVKANGTVKPRMSDKKRASDSSKRASKRSATPEDSDGHELEYKRSKRTAASDEARRRSSRNNAVSKSYIEADSDDDDNEMEHWDKAGEENKENLAQTTEVVGDDPMEDIDTNHADMAETKAQRSSRGSRSKKEPLAASTAQKQGRRSARTSARQGGNEPT